MAELRLGMLVDKRLNLLPVIAVIANLFAVGTNRKQPLELFDSRQGVFQLLDPGGQIPLQLHNPAAHVQAGTKFIAIKRLGDIIIRPGTQSLNDVGALPPPK